MTLRNNFTLIAILWICSYGAYGQQWHPGDTLNTTQKDSTRIDQFRNNEFDYTGQELVDASFPNSIPIFGTKSRIAFGGYVKLDYIQDFDGSYDRFQYEIQNVPACPDMDLYHQQDLSSSHLSKPLPSR